MTASQPRTGGAVVDIDRAQPSREALRWADDYARLRSLDLRAVHVWNYPSTFTFSVR